MDAELAIRHGPVQPIQQGVYNLSLLGHVAFLRMEVVGAKNGARAHREKWPTGNLLLAVHVGKPNTGK